MEELEDLKAEDITLVGSETEENEADAIPVNEEEELPEETQEEDDAPPAEDAAEQPENTPTGTEAPDFNQLLSERSEGKFQSFEALQTHLDQLGQNQKTPSQDLQNEWAQKFLDFSSGRTNDPKTSIKMFLETQLMEPDKLTSMEVVRHQMQMSHPERSESDIDFLLNAKYKLNEDNFEEDEIRLGKLQLDDDARSARKELLSLQEQIALPEQAPSETESLEQIQQANEQWQGSVESALSGFDSLDLTVNDKGDKYTFGVDNAEEVKTSMLNLPAFWSRYINSDGTENIDKLRQEMTVLHNLDKIIKAVSENGASRGRDEVLKERKNPTDTERKDRADGAYKSELEEIAEGLSAKFNN